MVFTVVRIAREEDNRQARAERVQAALKLRTTQSRYPHVEQNAAWDTFARQVIQQALGRSVSPDLQRASNVVLSLSGTEHRHRQYGRTRTIPPTPHCLPLRLRTEAPGRTVSAP